MKSPTKTYKPRGCDDFGCGHFGAPRGDHKHKGQDIITTFGEDIFSPIEGEITKQGYTYADDLSYRYVRVENAAYKVEIYYTKLRDNFKVGDSVCQSDFIATAQNIAKRYTTDKKKMKNHCHIQVFDKKANKWIDPLTVLEV
jgi:leukocyte cell-derived chemotaxin-2